MDFGWVCNSICERSNICILDIGLASGLEGILLQGTELLAVKMLRMALHTKDGTSQYQRNPCTSKRLSPGTLQRQVGTLQHPPHPVLLQHWAGTLQHPKVPSAFTALRGYFTAPTIWRVLHSTLLWPFNDALQHRGHQAHSTSDNIEPL